jgi:hypothetical protein
LLPSAPNKNFELAQITLQWAEEGNRLAASKIKAAAPKNNMVPFSSCIFFCLLIEATLKITFAGLPL